MELTLLNAVRNYLFALDSLREFEAENPYDSTSRWDLTFQERCQAEDILRIVVKRESNDL